MRITWLLEAADQLWGGVKVVLEDANRLHRLGHQVTVVSRSGPPQWMRVECGFRQVTDFRPEHLPDGDVILGTFWTTVPWAASAGPAKGVPVHFCQGYEGDSPNNAALRDRIEAVYRLPGVRHITIAGHLTRLLRERFGIEAAEAPNAVDLAVHRPGPERTPTAPFRIGLVGPYQVASKDLATGYAACRLAHAAGLQLVLVRVSNTNPDPNEQDLPFPIEWHRNVPPERMGDIYRSLDVFLGTSNSATEGFFLPALEAMACGVPTVLTDVPCVRDHGAGKGEDLFSLFVPPGDANAMAEAMVIATSLPEVRTTLRREGLAVAQRYTPERHTELLDAALRSFVPAPDESRRPEGQPTETLTAPLIAAGERLLGEDRAEDAVRCYLAALCLRPGDRDLRFALARAQERAGDLDGALHSYDALASLGCDEEPLHTARGLLLHAKGRMTDAAQAFRAALAVGHRTADAYNRLGVVLFQAGDFPGARNSFERAIVLQPEHADAQANLAALATA
ncbi:MAG: tetratricopeptide repeat protein [Planctomycetes bacterium]|nr:tetratricopeptide repeat protein [Planctomycetota bacterium]MCB9883969.1 tetratricopeptide repeat protein [Planctomycetota bacterium]